MNAIYFQNGAALILSMVILLVLTIFGITAMNITTMQQRVVGNMQERMIADECAETALRKIQSDLFNSGGGVGFEPELETNNDAGQQTVTTATPTTIACADAVTATFQYAGKRKAGITYGCYFYTYEINVDTGLNTGSRGAMALGVGMRRPSGCT